MNLAKAINLMVAARDDAILAAWVYMITDQAVHAVTDLSPYDAWDAYQRLYDLGLVEATAFHRTDPERAFFAHAATPSWSAIQGVISRYDTNLKEPPPMSKPRVTNPFATPDTALATSREERAPALPSSRGAMPLSPFGTAAPPSLNPFGASAALPPDGMVAARRLRNDVGPMFVPAGSPGDPNALPCRDPMGRSDQAWIIPEVYCCKQRLQMAGDGAERVGPDDLPGGAVSVIDAIFHAHCPHCGSVWHLSVGSAIHPDAMR